jgi:hypothetical protein
MISWLCSLALAAPMPEQRTLQEHRYGLPVAVEPVFLDSYVTFRQGVGSLTLRDVRYPGIPVPLQLQLVGLTETLRVQLRVSERAALYGFASGAVLAGANADSALFLGVSGGYDLRLGGAYSLVRTERSQLAVRVGGRRSVGLAVTPADLAVELLDDTQRALRRLQRGRWADSLLSTQAAWQGTASLSLATTVHPHVGLLASVSSRVGRVDVLTRDGRDGGLGLQLGAGAAVDLRGPGRPLGLQIGLQDRVERAPGLVDTLPERHRLGAVVQGYVDLGQVELGLVPSLAGAWRGGVQELEWGAEGRAVAFF